MQNYRALTFLRKTLGVAFAASILLSAVPAAAQQHGGSGRGSGGGGRSYSSGRGSGGYRGGAPSGGYRGGAPSGGYRGGAPSGGYNGGYRGTPSYSGGYRGGSSYRGGSYAHGNVNAYYARNPEAYRGYWAYGNGGRYYNGYWRNYWGSASWLWWGGHFGFWFPYNGINVFVYETSPDSCQYWDGYEWVPYYDPDTGYYCPY